MNSQDDFSYDEYAQKFFAKTVAF